MESGRGSSDYDRVETNGRGEGAGTNGSTVGASEKCSHECVFVEMTKFCNYSSGSSIEAASGHNFMQRL